MTTISELAAELSCEQGLDWTTALYVLDPVEDGTSEYVAAVCVISVRVEPLSVLRCHLIISPVWPDRVSVPVELPRQMGEEPPVMAPATVVGETCIVTGTLNASEHGLDCITALYCHVPADEGVSECEVLVLLMSVQLPPSSCRCHLTTEPV